MDGFWRVMKDTIGADDVLPIILNCINTLDGCSSPIRSNLFITFLA
jgi:hypothetical protein